MTEHTMGFKKYSLFASNILLILVITIFIWLSFMMNREPQDIYLNLALLIASGTVGWLVGILISPDSEKEASKFSAYSKAIATFVSGYLVSKVDKVIEKIFDPSFLFQPIPGYRLVSCIAGFTIALLVTFIVRVYVFGANLGEDDNQPQQNLPPINPATPLARTISPDFLAGESELLLTNTKSD